MTTAALVCRCAAGGSVEQAFEDLNVPRRPVHWRHHEAFGEGTPLVDQGSAPKLQ